MSAPKHCRLTVYSDSMNDLTIDLITSSNIVSFHFQIELRMLNVIEVATPGAKPKYSCPVCEAVFGYKHVARRHMLAKHTDFKYNCPHCQKEFNRKDLYSLHIRIEHALPSERDKDYFKQMHF